MNDIFRRSAIRENISPPTIVSCGSVSGTLIDTASTFPVGYVATKLDASKASIASIEILRIQCLMKSVVVLGATPKTRPLRIQSDATATGEGLQRRPGEFLRSQKCSVNGATLRFLMCHSRLTR